MMCDDDKTLCEIFDDIEKQFMNQKNINTELFEGQKCIKKNVEYLSNRLIQLIEKVNDDKKQLKNKILKLLSVTGFFVFLLLVISNAFNLRF